MRKVDMLFNRNFLVLWQGQVVSLLGTQAYLIAFMFWMTEATGRPALVGTMTMIGGLATFLSPIGGTLADRYSRKKLLVLLDLISGAAILTLAGLFFAFPDRIPLLVASLFLVNIIREICHTFFQPTASAIVPDLVTSDRLPAANAWIQGSHQIILFIGQGAGGVLFRILGAPILFLVDGITFVLSGISEMFIRLPEVRRPARVSLKQSFLDFSRETASGFRFVLTNPGLRIFLILAGIYNFFQASNFVLLPFYVKDVLSVDVDWYGFMLGGFGLGLFAGSLLGGIAGFKGRVRFLVMMICLVLVGVFRGGLAVTTQPVIATMLLSAAGLSTGFYGVYITSVLQSGIPTGVRGRTFGVITTFRWGVVPLGMGFFGVVADLSGISIPMIFLGSGCAIVAVTLWAAGRRPFRVFLIG
jgi:MFS family permease